MPRNWTNDNPVGKRRLKFKVAGWLSEDCLIPFSGNRLLSSDLLQPPGPKNVIGRLEISLRDENLDFSSDRTTDTEAVVSAIIGIQSLKRHELQNAILAFKNPKALVGSQSLKEELQMQQALAMIDGGQAGPPSAILLRLGSQPSLLGDRAKAILATVKLQNGSLAPGMNWLQSAIKNSWQWPASERLRALTDDGFSLPDAWERTARHCLLNSVHNEFIKKTSPDHAAQGLANITHVT